MRNHGEVKEEAQSVLFNIAKRIKHDCESALPDEELSAVSMLVDSYTRLYEEVNK